MIPRPFDYERPSSVEEAVSVLAAAGGRDAKLIAGGQSLVPMLSLGLARPDVLVDVSGLELSGLEVLGGRVRVGATTSHRTLELDPEVRRLLPLAAELVRLPDGTGVGFHEEAQRADDFALACAAAVVEPGGRAGRVVVGGVGDRPLRFDGAPGELAATVESMVEPEEDAFVSAAFRRRLAGVCSRRALALAREDAAA